MTPQGLADIFLTAVIAGPLGLYLWGGTGTGKTFMMGTPDEGIAVNDEVAAVISNLTDLESIIIDPGSNTGSVEVFTASV